VVRVGVVAAAIVVAAGAGDIAGATGVLQDALAQDWFWSPPPPPPPRQRGDGGPASSPEGKEREQIHLLLFSGVDLWRHAAFAHDGLLWMPGGAGADGFLLKLTASAGIYRYRAGALADTEVQGWMTGAAVMPGVSFKRHGVSVAAYVGGDWQSHALSPLDPGNRLQGRRVGIRFAVDLWAEPVPQAMLALSAMLTTVGGQYAARAAVGWRLLDAFHLGPEVTVYGAPDYRQIRLGLHVTALRTELFDWRFEWQGAVGYAFDDDDRDGVYARLGILVRH